MKPITAVFTLFLCACSIPAFAQKRTIELSTYDYLPFNGKSLKEGGAITKLTAMAFQKAGYQVKVTHRSEPWARILTMAKDGEYDALCAVWASKERESYLAVTDGILNNDVGCFTLSTDPLKAGSLQDIKAQNLSVGVVRGYGLPKAFTDAKLGLDEAADDAMLINKLLQGRSRVILSDKAVAIYFANKVDAESAKKLEWLFSVESTPLRTGIVKTGKSDWQTVVQDYNQALAALIKDGTVNKVLKEYNLR